MRSARLRVAGATALGGAMAAMCLFTGSAQAAKAVYPAGGGTFSGGAEGWQVTEAGCNVAVLCTASGGYDAANGNPPGSLASKATILLGLLGLFEATATTQSPDFTAAEGGAGTLHLDLQFESGELAALGPQASYVASLIDHTSGTTSEVLSGTLGEADSSFSGKDGVVTLKAGHSYAISIQAKISSTTASAGLLGGSSAVRFDNVALTTGTSGGGGGGGGGGSGSGGGASALSSRGLLSILRHGAVSGPAVLRGRRLFVKVSCPGKIGRACHIRAWGMLNRHRAATAPHTVKIGKGKGRRIALRVKRWARPKLAKRKRLLVRQRVRAGKVRTTFFQRRMLIRRR